MLLPLWRRLQLYLGSHPWLRNSICYRVEKERKREEERREGERRKERWGKKEKERKERNLPSPAGGEAKIGTQAGPMAEASEPLDRVEHE